MYVCPQDTLLGVSKMSYRDTFITRDIMMNMAMWLTKTEWDGMLPTPAVLVPNKVSRSAGPHRPEQRGEKTYCHHDNHLSATLSLSLSLSVYVCLTPLSVPATVPPASSISVYIYINE